MRSTASSSPPRAWPWRRSLLLRLFLAMKVSLWLVMGALIVLMVVAFRVPGVFPGESALRLAGFVGQMLSDAWGSPTGLARMTDTLAGRLGMDIVVFDLDGRALATAVRRPLAPPTNLLDAARAPLVLRGPDFRSEQTWVVGAPVEVRGALRAIVVARMRNAGPLQRPLRTYFIVGVAFALTFVLALYLSRTITRPLARLTRTAERFGAGDLSARSGLTDPDEIGRLARSFDAMADRIEAMRHGERELLATISHELRTPLARMRVTLGLVNARDDDTRRRISDADHDLEGLHRLVSDLLLESRLDVGALTLHRNWIQLKELVHRSRERLRPLWPDRVVQEDVDEDLFVHVDEALLLRVLDNLMENACKYDPSGLPIVVRGRERGEQVELLVCDHGPGIALEDVDRLFLPFARGKRTASSADGAGLGLALCRRLVEAHGGSLRIVPTEGEGTRMQILLARLRADSPDLAGRL